MSHEFVEAYLKEHELNIIESDSNRPWGGWYLFWENSSSDKKILHVLPGT
ncbi:MAG TPA: hypothetical protein VLG50_08215 [Candidatus Saccharimonadales bacterium]|nr:hypothetical protein [Candidatus Saccharimonadales bacterium]